jgi:glutathionylspermidine synthase
MKRHSGTPRATFETRLRALGVWPADGAPYYDESAYYSFTEDQIETLYEATTELEAMVGKAVEQVIAKNRFAELGISPSLAAYAKASFEREDPSVYGRMDLAYDGVNPPKLLEYNADTPTALFESAVLQWEWLDETGLGHDQFNSIHEALIERWRFLRTASGIEHLTLAGMLDEDDDRITLGYMEDVALQAGWKTSLSELEEIGFDGRDFFDQERKKIKALFKLYPWDWLAQEDFFTSLVAADLPVMEAAWRVIPASKGILPILWEMFPDHPNLLPSSFRAHDIPGPKVSKPLLGREGADIALIDVMEAPAPIEGGYADQGQVWQSYAALPSFDGWHPVIGSWVIGGQACGIGLREDRSLITGPDARFRPHCIEFED